MENKFDLGYIKERTEKEKQFLQKFKITEVDAIPETEKYSYGGKYSALIAIIQTMNLGQIIKIETPDKKESGRLYNNLFNIKKLNKSNPVTFVFYKRNSCIYIKRTE